jgi:hypothetical protein
LRESGRASTGAHPASAAHSLQPDQPELRARKRASGLTLRFEDMTMANMKFVLFTVAALVALGYHAMQF